MSQASILVTGGAGYIGSHVVQQLGKAGEPVVVIDNLSTGFADAVTHGELIVGDIGDETLVRDVIQQFNVRAVMHFAASTIVPESVEDPLKYYKNNTANTRHLLACCQAAGIQHFIFSSTAAVYGIPNHPICTEETATQPINPYGTSKLMSEMMLKDLGKASNLSYVILRYFNVAGSDPTGRVGQRTKKATLLTKVAVETALGKREQLHVYGTDYDTPDGTGVRDYIHVQDLAMAHLKALEYLRNGNASITLNCGYGHGFSVREVIQAVEKASGVKLNVNETARRAGDPPMLIAKVDRAQQCLQWTPEFDDLDTIISHALAFEKSHNTDH